MKNFKQYLRQSLYEQQRMSYNPPAAKKGVGNNRAAQFPISTWKPGPMDAFNGQMSGWGFASDCSNPWCCSQADCYVWWPNGSYWICPDGDMASCVPCEGDCQI